MQTSELTGAALDWAVAKCWYTDRAFEPTEGRTTIRVLRSPENTGEYHSDWFMFRPSTEWAQGGPIIEREKIEVIPPVPDWCDDSNDAEWMALTLPEVRGDATLETGPTPLIAAMRCYVALKLGDEVAIPNELTGVNK